MIQLQTDQSELVMLNGSKMLTFYQEVQHSQLGFNHKVTLQPTLSCTIYSVDVQFILVRTVLFKLQMFNLKIQSVDTLM
jgi:hypothetical protein